MSLPYRPRPERPAIIRVTPPTSTLVLHHTPRVVRESGVGGWIERPHDRAKASVEWAGTPLHRLTLDVFFDGIRRGTDVEAECAALHRLGLPDAATGQPPTVRLNFGHGQQLLWVIDDIVTTGQETAGRRVQARFDVHLVEWVEAKLALSPVEAVEQSVGAYQPRPSIGETQPAGRTYTVVPGDTLSAIAARELGAPGRFVEIYALNSPPLTSPDIIQVGQVLKMPAA